MTEPPSPPEPASPEPSGQARGWAIRPFREADRERVRTLTIEGFDGVSLEQRLDRLWPDVAPMGWAERKWLEVADDLARHPAGCFVAELTGAELAGAELVGEVVGYVTTAVHEGRRQGRIPNIAVDARLRNRGLGRALLEAALADFRRRGLRVARIETLESNAVGQHLYRAVGFREIARQSHLALRLD